MHATPEGPAPAWNAISLIYNSLGLPRPHPAQVRRRPRVRDLFDAAVHADLYRQSDTRRLVVIHNNKVMFPLMPPGVQQFDWCARRAGGGAGLAG
jgi:hypothetical protein